MKMNFEGLGRDSNEKEEENMRKELYNGTIPEKPGMHPADLKITLKEAIEKQSKEMVVMAADLTRLENEHARSMVLTKADFTLEDEGDEHKGRSKLVIEMDMQQKRHDLYEAEANMKELEKNYKNLMNVGQNPDLN